MSLNHFCDVEINISVTARIFEWITQHFCVYLNRCWSFQWYIHASKAIVLCYASLCAVEILRYTRQGAGVRKEGA